MHCSFRPILFTLLFLFSVPAASAKDTQHQGVVSHFGLKRDSGTPLVEVRLSSTVTGLFAIDTGAYDCIMTASLAKRLGDKQDANPQFMNELLLGSSLVATSVVHTHNLMIDKLHISSLDFLVAPNNFFGTQNGRPIDGLLGGTLLSHFALLLDYPKRTLAWIYPGNLNGQAVTDLGLDPKNAIDLHQISGTQIEGSFQIDFNLKQYSAPVHLESGSRKHTEEMIVDTGSRRSFVSADAAKHLNLVSQGLEPYGYIFLAPDLACKATIPLFHLGKLSLSDIQVLYPSHRDAKMISLLGEDVLGKCVVLLDFGPNRLYLKPILPGLTADPLLAYDAHTVDWERLRKAPDGPDFSDLLAADLTADAWDGAPQKVARLKAALTGKPEDADLEMKIGFVLLGGNDPVGAKAAFAQAAVLRQADAEAHPDDPERAAHWTEALIVAGQDEKALDIAQKNAVHWPKSSVVWRTFGQAQENRAAVLLVGAWGKTVTEDQLLEPFPKIDHRPDRPDPVHIQQISLLRQGARDSLGQAIALAPQDPASYQSRGRFWVVDTWLLELMQDLDIKDQSPSTATAAAAVLSDYQDQIRLDPDNVSLLRGVAIVDTALPVFHDWKWIQEHLKGSGQKMDMEKGSLMTAKTASALLTALAQSSDKLLAAQALEALGEVQSVQDDPAAEVTLRQAVALDPDRVGALSALASRLVAANRFLDLRDLLTAQIVQRDTLPVRLLLAAVDKALDKPDEAETQVRAALKAAPANPVANQMLAGLLLARSGYDYGVLLEVPPCLVQAKAGYGAQATPQQKAGLRTMQAVWLALTSDPAGARRQLIDLSKEEPTSTQVREALSAMTIPPSAP